jgi:hypothetical protein
LKRFHKILIVALLQIFCFQQNIFAQDTISIDTNPVRKKFIAEPLRATMLAVVFPGLGQVYNRKYWKIPLVYAGFGGLVYSIGFNSTNYTTYMKAYQDFTDNIPATNSFQLLPGLRDEDPASYDPIKNPQTYSYYKDQMLRLVDYYKRYRDLSYIGIAGWYLISILDANVDASLFNYDISDNLDVAVLPVQMALPGGYIGAGINVSFRVNF